ncbi:hypothetical protein CQP30_19100 [Yersinia pestis]|uniref:Membrane protein n=16 Tax=Yersinia pseudotuberculosis complex TaxID=1649845 RepID=A0AAX2I0V5_YERPE|nr:MULTISPECIES: YjaA family stress response protein [Yersinia pseudotuberculosis complex]EDR31671.1 conserved hypothetical protein [Yersinia pestis biovar Orientalis str. IP275]EFA46937.1 conserved hypothetical protein [Yersinia pestis KIM D27]ERP77024.1 stress response protein [Yersinia pestis S3]ERP77365.1 stress response protein [Yersinia pestis 24H]CQD58623.1 Uncharacterised protein [Yersinia intermedia]
MPFFYLQIRKNHLTLKNLDSQKVVSGTANFSTERLLIGEFFIAEACLYPLVSQVLPGFINQLKRRCLRTHILIHAQEMLEGGVSQVEQRIMREFTVPSFPKGYHSLYAAPQTLSDDAVKRIILMGSETLLTAADLKI